MKEISLNRIQVRDSERMVGEGEAETAMEWGARDLRQKIKQHTKRVPFEPIHSKKYSQQRHSPD